MADKLEIQPMASGNLSLFITDQVSWESFPSAAQAFVQRVGGRVVRRIDTPVERMWIVVIRWRLFFLTFDNFPLGLSLDSMSRWCNPVIQNLFLDLGGSNR
jgi:hypothetical protein